MRVLIVDDEPAARRRLALMLEGLDVELVGEARNGVEALELIAARRPDLVLLDIAMPEIDGFDVVLHLEAPRPLIVFQTAHDEFALKAFEHEALDYVVKPVELGRLRQALERGERRLADRPARLEDAALRRLQAALSPPPIRASRLLVRSGKGHRLMALREIVRFTADQGVVHAHTASGRHLVDRTLSELEERTGGGFVRVSRSDLVSLERIDRIVSATDGTATLTLDDGNRIHVTRRRASEVRRSLEG